MNRVIVIGLVLALLGGTVSYGIVAAAGPSDLDRVVAAAFGVDTRHVAVDVAGSRPGRTPPVTGRHRPLATGATAASAAAAWRQLG